MGFLTAKPSHALLPYIKQYWCLESYQPGNFNYIHRIVPNGLMELMFFLKKPPVVLNTKKAFEGHTIISGHQKGFYDMQIGNELSLFSVSFHPYGAMMFFNIPLSELFNQNVALNHLIRAESSEIETKLQEVTTFEQRVKVMNEFLTKQLRLNYKPYEYKRLAHCINLINQFNGLVKIETLADATCLSRKQFERIFNRHIGASPKQFLRAVRFQFALYTKQKNPHVNLTELAYTCGYYDQAHMINDFQYLSGKTPGTYFDDCEPFSDYFSSF